MLRQEHTGKNQLARAIVKASLINKYRTTKQKGTQETAKPENRKRTRFKQYL